MGLRAIIKNRCILNSLASLLLFGIAACQTVPPAPLSPYTAEQIAVLKEYRFEEADENWMLGLDDKLLFPSDESHLAEDQLRQIGRMASALAEVGIHGARVEGHTDSTGTPEYNRELSVRRADAVKSALISGGMIAEAVTAVGMGAARPIESNATAAGRHQNRRVVIVISPADATPY
jgi:OOP family OmpA-OmpF porin